jgi:5-formyltetrahydrofolate cyclo-ligase
MSDEQETRTHHPSPITHLSLTRAQLRTAMRQQRKAVPKTLADAAARTIARQLSRRLLKKELRIALYAAFDGEIDLSGVVRQAQRVGCVIYAPRIVNMRARRMEFIEVARHTFAHGGAKPNRYSILGPRNNLHRRIDPRLLDVVLLPLVAFDMHGWRLGFGAGFYDRKLEFLRRKIRNKPYLIGVGYEFQRVTPQTPGAWDVLLDAVVTERGFQRCHPLHSQ